MGYHSQNLSSSHRDEDNPLPSNPVRFEETQSTSIPSEDIKKMNRLSSHTTLLQLDQASKLVWSG